MVPGSASGKNLQNIQPVTTRVHVFVNPAIVFALLV